MADISLIVSNLNLSCILFIYDIGYINNFDFIYVANKECDAALQSLYTVQCDPNSNMHEYGYHKTIFSSLQTADQTIGRSLLVQN
jgi:hypothetical protein